MVRRQAHARFSSLLLASPAHPRLPSQVITRGILNVDLNSLTSVAGSTLSPSPSYLEQPLTSQQASRTMSLLNTAMLETLNVLVVKPTWAGAAAPAPLIPASRFAAADLAAAVPALAASFAGYGVLAALYPSRTQALPPFLDGVVALHLSDPRFSIGLALPGDAAAIAASQRIGSLVARIIVASKVGDGFATYKSYSFNATLAATMVPPLFQYRPTGIWPAAFGAAVTAAGLSSPANAPAAFLYPQLQSVTPFVSAAASAWVPNTKNLKILGVADPAKNSPFFTQAVSGIALANTLSNADAPAVLGPQYNISNGPNSTVAPDWFGYNFSIRAYPDPLVQPATQAALAASEPGVTASSYYADLNQVRWLGQKNSIYRTQAQTNVVYFWRLGGNTGALPGMFSNVATSLLQANYSTSLTTTGGLYASAALFTRMHVSIWDGSASGWAAKYKYLHWRPETALRYGDNSTLLYNTSSVNGNWPSELTPVYGSPSTPGGVSFTPLFNATANVTSGPATSLDPVNAPFHQLHTYWSPELTSPGHPEYPSTHSVACEAAVVTLRLFFGTDSVAAINANSTLKLLSEDSYLSYGSGPGNGGQPWVGNATNSSNVLRYLNLTSGNITTSTLPVGLLPITYSTLSKMSRDCSDSRVWGGIHLNGSTTDGIYLGNTVASYVFKGYPGNLTTTVAAALNLFF